MYRAVFLALLSHWRRHPFQFLTLILGISLATALWSGVQAINAEARKSYQEAASILGGTKSLVDPTGADIPLATLSLLRRSGWLVSPVVEGFLPDDQGKVTLIGIDPFTMQGNFAGSFSDSFAVVDFLGPDGLLLASSSTAMRLAQYMPNVQIEEAVAEGTVLADVLTAQQILEKDGFTRLALASDQPLLQPPLNEVSDQLIVEQPRDTDSLSGLTNSFHLTLTAFGLLSFAVGLFIVNGAVGLAFEQRRTVFRTLRALGVATQSLVLSLIIEAFALAVFAGLLGIALGYFIAASLLPDVAATLRGLYGANVQGQLTLAPSWWLSGVAIAILGTGLAVLGTLIKAARMPLLAPAKPRAWLMTTTDNLRNQAWVACTLVALSGILAASGTGLAGSFAVLASFLIGAALALPVLIAPIISLCRSSSKSAVPQWFWADTQQQLPGLSMALMALMLALAANIGVGTMVGSFRATFSDWLDQRLVSELYVNLENEADVPDFKRFVADEVDAVLPIWHSERTIYGAQTEIYGVIDHPTYRENWPLISRAPDVWGQVFRNEAGLINEQMAYRQELSLGDVISMPGGWDIKVAGIYSDYGNPSGQIIISTALLEKRFDDIDRTEFGLRLPVSKVENLRLELVERLQLSPNSIIDQTSLKEFSLAVFERTFTVTSALNALTLLVAGIAILTSLLTLAGMRLPQLAPVWAIGLSRRQLASLEVVRSLVLAVFTFVLSLPVGLVLAWVLLSDVNVEAFGWKLPMHLFPADWLSLAILTSLAAIGASVWPAYALARKDPSDLTGVFSVEK